MTNTTDTFWSVDGVSLQTHAKNIQTLGARFSPPPLRGEDILIPYAKGRRWVPKVADSRVIPLAMWVRGYNDDGSVSANAVRKFEENWRALRNLLWTPDRQVLLQKRFYVNGLLRSATAKAQFSGGLEPTMIGRAGAKFVVDLTLADPYFYDDELKTFNLVNGNNTLAVLGDVPTENLKLTINGSRNNTIVRAPNRNIQVQYTGNLATGDTAVIDVPIRSAQTTPSGVPTYDSNGRVIHSGAAHWLDLAPNSDVINLSSTSGAGLVVLQGRGAWI